MYLQLSIKFTNEPPLGIKAGLKRTYAGITQDFLDICSLSQWKPLLYGVSFLHTVVQVVPAVVYNTHVSLYNCSSNIYTGQQ